MDIVVTLTTIPDRLHNTSYRHDIKYCIDALLNFNHHDYEIHFNIPEFYQHTGEEYIIPDWLQEKCESYNFLKIFRTKDYGSATKLIPTVQRITNPDCTIITVDDDMVYHKELINEHIKNRQSWPDYVVGYDGIRSRNTDGSFASHFKDHRDHYFSATGRNSLVDILQAYKSISYQRSFFKEDFTEFMINEGTWCDDTSISAYFAKHKRGRLCSFFKDDTVCEKYEDWMKNLKNTFPIDRYTDHGSKEGCNLSREKNTNNETVKDKTNNLYKKYLDICYQGQVWTI
jgi:hypothetical protein